MLKGTNKKEQNIPTWKLPYLNSHTQILPPEESKPRRTSAANRQFDLHTNFASIPRYHALQDKNLAYFFDKASNRKLLEGLRLQEKKKKAQNTKESKTHRSKNKEISQTDFVDYLQKMKIKVTNSQQQ